MIAVKPELQCSLVYKSITSELLSIKLHHRKSASIISACYRPPNCLPAESARCVVDELHGIRINLPSTEFWLSEDCNLPDIDWSNHTIKSYQYPKSMSFEFLNLPFYCDLEQMVRMPSRGNNIIDIFFTAHPSLVDKCVSIPGVGGHDAAVLDMSTTPQCNKPIKRKILLWNKADISSLRYDLNMFSSYFVRQSFPDATFCWTVFRNNVIQLMKKYVPNRITRFRKTNSWLNTETGRMVRRKNSALTKAQFTKSPRDLETYKYLKSKCQRFIRQPCNAYKQNIVCHDARKNPKKFWSFVKSKKTRCFRRCSFV